MKNIVVIMMLLLFSCNHAKKKASEQTVSVPATPAVPEDSVVIKLRAKMLDAEKQDLQAASIIKQIKIDSLQYNMISFKEYYSIQKKELSRVFQFSANKEKTIKAMVYLDKMIANSSEKPVVYAVQFHLNALLANTTLYNEHHVKYLKENMTEMNILFP